MFIIFFIGDFVGRRSRSFGKVDVEGELVVEVE